MVIACPECATKFRVNPDRIPAQGAKVRCARCKHIFFTPKPEMPAAPVAPAPEIVPPPVAPVPPAAERFAADDNDDRFGPLDEGFEEPASGESDFNYERFHELDAKAPASDSFSFSPNAPKEPPAAPATEEDDFSFGAPPVNTAAAGVGSGAAADQLLANGFTPEPDEEPAEPVTTIPAPSKQGGIFGSIIRILLLLVLGLLLLGGVLVYMNGPEQLQQTLQQLLGQQDQAPAKAGEIALSNLQGMFVNNQEAGELFVIRGEAINKFKEPRASIQVKGVIFDQSGKPLVQKTIFCGNQLTDQELQTLPFSKIEEMMGNQFGKSLSNMNINKGQAIPFTIVFRDLPKNLTEFSVDVTTSKPAAQ